MALRLRFAAVALFSVVSLSLHAAAGDYFIRHLAGAPHSIQPVTPLDSPYDVAVDGEGNVYIAESSNYVVRKLSVSGELTVLAGEIGRRGSADGVGAAARFGFMDQIVVAPDGTLFLTDGNETIRKITPDGVVTTFAGQAGSSGSADGVGSAARFNEPTGMALDRSGNLYVADTYNHTIRKITPAGVVTTLAGTPGGEGGADGTGSAARFSFPRGIAIDVSGNLYVADPGNEEIRRVTPSGVVTTFAGSLEGSVDGRGTAARFNAPVDIVVDRSGVFYVADKDNNTIRRITASGDVTTFAGSAGAAGALDGVGTSARFNDPWGIGIDLVGNVYVADRGNDAIRRITPQGLVTTLGTLALREGTADGPALNARFKGPRGVAVDRLGNVFVADTENHTIRKISASGEVTTFAGSAGLTGSTNGTGPAARFYYPEDVAIDTNGTLYVADNLNHSIRKITPDGVVSTYAGSGFAGSNDGTGTSARFRFPTGVAVDALGNVYVADEGNELVRKISLTREVTTIARGFDNPADVAVDAAGNVYVADSFDDVIRKVSPAGEVTTFAGTIDQAGSADGTGAAARFLAPYRLAIDEAGTLYVTDGDRIRKITPAGVVTSIAGQYNLEGNQDGAGISALFRNPYGIAVDASGQLFIADRDNHSIRIGIALQERPRQRAVRGR